MAKKRFNKNDIIRYGIAGVVPTSLYFFKDKVDNEVAKMAAKAEKEDATDEEKKKAYNNRAMITYIGLGAVTGLVGGGLGNMVTKRKFMSMDALIAGIVVGSLVGYTGYNRIKRK